MEVCRTLKQLLQDLSPQLIHHSIALLPAGNLTQLAKVCFSALLTEVAVENDVCCILALSSEYFSFNFLRDDALECQPPAKGFCIHCFEELILKLLQYLCSCQGKAEMTSVSDISTALTNDIVEAHCYVLITRD